MHIILWILKWAGLLLVFLLALLLLLLLLALFVPVRYRLEADTRDRTRIWGRAGWFFRLLSFRASYEEGAFTYSLRLCGIPLRQSGEKAGERRKKRKGRPKKQKKAVSEKETLPASQEPSGGSREAVKPVETGKQLEHRKAAGEETEEAPVRPGLGERLCAAVRNWMDKIKAACLAFFYRVRQWRRSIKRAVRKGKKFLSFLRDEGNRPGFLQLFCFLKKTLKHLGPTRIKGEVTFGTGDPCSTGQLLGAAGLFYGWYGKDVRLTPDFEEKGFKARLKVKGRIRAGTLLILLIKLFVNRDFHTVLEQWKQWNAEE